MPVHNEIIVLLIYHFRWILIDTIDTICTSPIFGNIKIEENNYSWEKSTDNWDEMIMITCSTKPSDLTSTTSWLFGFQRC